MAHMPLSHQRDRERNDSTEHANDKFALRAIFHEVLTTTRRSRICTESTVIF
jgi:hypothetical protein